MPLANRARFAGMMVVLLDATWTPLTRSSSVDGPSGALAGSSANTVFKEFAPSTGTAIGWDEFDGINCREAVLASRAGAGVWLSPHHPAWISDPGARPAGSGLEKRVSALAALLARNTG